MRLFNHLYIAPRLKTSGAYSLNSPACFLGLGGPHIAFFASLAVVRSHMLIYLDIPEYIDNSAAKKSLNGEAENVKMEIT
jgi:hypothetical protein